MKRLYALCSLLSLLSLTAQADKVIMKDGTVYQGKILVDTDKALIIGNPPFDPNQYLLESKDIDTIVYEEYRLSPPAERRRGFLLETHLTGNVFSSEELSLGASPGLYAGLGFRIHPLFEIDGGLHWLPRLPAAASGLSVSDGTTTRSYETFWLTSGRIAGRFYPLFYKKKWKTEPYVTVGYGWSRLIPKASGDTLKGSGWLGGAGVLHPFTTHLFLEGQFLYQRTGFDQTNFLGREGLLHPQINEHQYSFSLGMSYRI